MRRSIFVALFRGGSSLIACLGSIEGTNPCRVAAVPPTLDARTGLVVLLVGSCKDLERRNVYQVVEAADAMRFPPPSFKFTQRV